MKQVKTAVVGCGMISDIYIKNLQNLFSVIDLGGLCNRSPRAAEEKSAFFWHPVMTLEEIKADPSIWKECLDRDGEGLHHLAFHTEHIENDVQQLREMGYPVVQTGNWPDTLRDGAYAYADGTDTPKCIVELLDFKRK